MNDEFEAVEEVAKATQEVAKTASKAIGVGERLGHFVAKFIGGPLEQATGIVEDKLKYLRWERQVRLMQRAEAFLHESGLAAPTRPIPMKFAIPLLQGASLEDDDELQDRWAALLVNAANAASGVELKRAYIDILEQIGPLEAKILDKIYSLPYAETRHQGVVTVDLPERVSIRPPTAEDKEPRAEVVLALANLDRLGGISVGRSWGGGQIFGAANPTLLGKSFVEACTLQKT